MSSNDRLAALAKTLRESKGLTQAQLVAASEQAGHTLSQPTYSTLESGKRRWNTAYIDAVAAGLGEDPSVFLAEPTGPMARLERLAGEVIDALAELVRPAAIG